MVVATAKQTELIDKLLAIANGNMDLVHEAIRASVDSKTKKADLSKVVAYILAKKDDLARQREVA